MAKTTQYEFNWNRPGDAAEAVPPPEPPAPAAPRLATPSPLLEEARFSTVSDADEEPAPADDSLEEEHFPILPNPVPLPEAIGRGVFGREGDSVIDPSPEEVAAITEHQGDRLVELISRLSELNESLANAKGEARAKLYREKDHLESAYQGALAMYAEDFGEQAAGQLNAWARNQVDAQNGNAYYPGHPWHYYHEGDAAEPIPVDQIQAASDAAIGSLGALPKDPKKRTEKLQTMLQEQREQLEADKRRYQELIDRGVDALSEYDRNIAHGGDDEMAWASAIALKYNHMRSGLGRVACLEESLKQSSSTRSRRRRAGGNR